MIITRQVKKKSYLNITGHETIESVQNEFNRAYPFLKIAFFKSPGLKGKGNQKANIYLENKKLSEIQEKNRQGYYDLCENITVADLETDMQLMFGLYVQVFRKSGSLWLETTVTDDWTLGQQNEEGRSLERYLKSDKENRESPGFFSI